ncbi:MAG: hypothetical protein IPP82_02355 [Xanthomonadales bacterium]|nr:hypothetical protein [Xanthomonadales bacterium]
MKAVCEQCHERPAVPGAIKWYGALLIGGWLGFGSYCKDCAGGMNFVGLLAVSAIAVVAFVLAVIVW